MRLDGRLPGSCAENRDFYAGDVAELEVSEELEVARFDLVSRDESLDDTGAVAQVHKRSAPHDAERGHTTGCTYLLGRLGLIGAIGEERQGFGRRVRLEVSRRVGVDAS